MSPPGSVFPAFPNQYKLVGPKSPRKVGGLVGRPPAPSEFPKRRSNGFTLAKWRLKMAPQKLVGIDVSKDSFTLAILSPEDGSFSTHTSPSATRT